MTCAHPKGHRVFLGREISGDLNSPAIYGWQCDSCYIVRRGHWHGTADQPRFVEGECRGGAPGDRYPL